MKEQKFEKIVKYEEGYEGRGLISMLILSLFYMIFTCAFIVSLRTEYNNHFFPIGWFIFGWLVMITISIRASFEKKVYWRKVK